MTPNVKNLLIMDFYSFSPTGAIVRFDDFVSYVPKLVTFRWRLTRPHSNAMFKLDAVITGLPEILCTELEGAFRDIDRLSAEEISAYHSKRNHSSILDLTGKNLVKLTVPHLFHFHLW